MAGAVTRLLVAIEPRVRVTGMVKHAVEDQPHPFTLRIVAQAQQRAYELLTDIRWNGSFSRNDIGWRAIAREKTNG